MFFNSPLFSEAEERVKSIIPVSYTHLDVYKRQLYDWYKFLTSKEVEQSSKEFCGLRGIKWSFISPSAPHFGGLWESGVRSVKFHLRRVIGGTILNLSLIHI